VCDDQFHPTDQVISSRFSVASSLHPIDTVGEAILSSVKLLASTQSTLASMGTPQHYLKNRFCERQAVN
jgi:hypothetical protein